MELLGPATLAVRDPRFSGMARAPLHVPNATQAVAEALARPSHCVPTGGVMLSMSNPHHQPLRNHQFAKIRHVKCLMDRLVSVCWGDWDDGYGTCVNSPCKMANTTKGTVFDKNSACAPSDYRRSQYVSLNWAKRRGVLKGKARPGSRCGSASLLIHSVWRHRIGRALPTTSQVALLHGRAARRARHPLDRGGCCHQPQPVGEPRGNPRRRRAVARPPWRASAN